MQGPQHITYLLFLFLWSYRVHIIKTQTVRRWFLLLGPCLGSLCRDEKWATRTPEGRFAQPPVSALQKNARRKGAKLSFSKGDGLLAAFRAQTNHNSSVIKTSPRGSAGDGWHFQTRYLAKLPLSHSVQRSQLQHLPDTFAGGGFTQIFFFFFQEPPRWVQGLCLHAQSETSTRYQSTFPCSCPFLMCQSFTVFKNLFSSWGPR